MMAGHSKNWLSAGLQFIQYLMLGVWIGSLVAVPVFAARIFKVLSEDRYKAGEIVGGSLNILGIIHLVCGCLLLLSIIAGLMSRTASGSDCMTAKVLKIVLPILMLLITAYLIFHVGPTMNELRSEASQISFEEWQGEGKDIFDRLHRRYEVMSQIVLLTGLGLLILITKENVAAKEA